MRTKYLRNKKIKGILADTFVLGASLVVMVGVAVWYISLI